MDIYDLPEFLTTTEVATIVRVSTSTVRRWGQTGILTTASLGRQYLFSRDEIYEKMKPLFSQPKQTSLASL